MIENQNIQWDDIEKFLITDTKILILAKRQVVEIKRSSIISVYKEDDSNIKGDSKITIFLVNGSPIVILKFKKEDQKKFKKTDDLDSEIVDLYDSIDNVFIFWKDQIIL